MTATEAQQMTRNSLCPICGAYTDAVLQLQFGAKMNLPTQPTIRFCPSDNFLFAAAGSQADYDEFYASKPNDSYHQEVSGGALSSPISVLQRSHLLRVLHGFFDHDRKVLDFGCGEGYLLLELAPNFPSSNFFGFDPSPSVGIGGRKAAALGLKNVQIADTQARAENAPYDLVIASHLIEHLVDFDTLQLFSHLLTDDGRLYIEVPNALQYRSHYRREFLYYFDRLHVNHFTPQSLANLASRYGFTCTSQFEYSFPYRDGGEYPALGMLFRKGQKVTHIASPSVLDTTREYIFQERQRAAKIAATLDAFEGVLVWGTGDNFWRSVQNEGPLSKLRQVVLLDRRPQEITVGGRTYKTQDPLDGIRDFKWPVAITVSEGRNSIREQVDKIDPSRRIYFL